MPSAWSPPASYARLPDAPSRDIPAGLHPLDHIDRKAIEGLLLVREPSDLDLVNAAGLITRYRDSRLSPDLRDLLDRVLRNWSLGQAELFSLTRAIWRSGWTPTAALSGAAIGSGADVEN
jgi:hypothetical protein